MPNQSKSWVNIRIVSPMKLLSFCLYFLMLLASCRNSSQEAKESKNDSVSSASPSASSSDASSTPDTSNQANINWLEEWPEITFKSDATDQPNVEREKKRIRVYVRGWLAEYNADHGRNYIVKEFKFEERSRSPLRYAVSAFLMPPAREVEHAGGHLVPQEPPPPDGIQ